MPPLFSRFSGYTPTIEKTLDLDAQFFLHACSHAHVSQILGIQIPNYSYFRCADKNTANFQGIYNSHISDYGSHNFA